LELYLLSLQAPPWLVVGQLYFTLVPSRETSVAHTMCFSRYS
jgi:hypothetical protein